MKTRDEEMSQLKWVIMLLVVTATIFGSLWAYPYVVRITQPLAHIDVKKICYDKNYDYVCEPTKSDDGIPATQCACTFRSNPLEGWTEQCYENVTVEKYKVIENNPSLCMDGCTPEKLCMLVESGSDANGMVKYYSLNCTYIPDITCKVACMAEKPHIQFYNETICTKKILVKEVGQ